jgi:hypothetical protein
VTPTRGKQETQEWKENIATLFISMSVWNPQTHVQPIHHREHHYLGNQSLEEVRQQEAHLHKEKQLQETSLGNLSQVSTPCGGGSSSVLRMAGHNPTIILPEILRRSTRRSRETSINLR